MLLVSHVVHGQIQFESTVIEFHPDHHGAAVPAFLPWLHDGPPPVHVVGGRCAHRKEERGINVRDVRVAAAVRERPPRGGPSARPVPTGSLRRRRRPPAVPRRLCRHTGRCAPGGPHRSVGPVPAGRSGGSPGRSTGCRSHGTIRPVTAACRRPGGPPGRAPFAAVLPSRRRPLGAAVVAPDEHAVLVRLLRPTPVCGPSSPGPVSGRLDPQDGI
mmetsp:Transcript_49313/g.96453  ORF Transcript_49313/g.96453 Transcript_49313/m.96453 type:complete len:215 (+) Transcript_49313:189-833(+)